MHIGDLSEMIELINKLKEPDVWIFHSFQMPPEDRLITIAKQYSNSSNIYNFNNFIGCIWFFDYTHEIPQLYSKFLLFNWKV